MFIAEIANFFVAVIGTVQPEFCCPPIHNEVDESQGSQEKNSCNGANEGDEMFFNDEPFLSTNNEPNFNDREEMQQSLCKWFGQSLGTNITILVASVIPLALFAIMLLYSDLNSSNLCFETKHRNGSSQLTSIMKDKLIGESIEAVLLSLWFPGSMLLLFGKQEFKSHYLLTLLFNLICGGIVVVYKVMLFLFGVFHTKQFYTYPGNILFFLGIVSGSGYIARKIPGSDSCRLIFSLTGENFVAGFLYRMVYRYKIVQWFNGEENEIKKALIAAMIPIIPTIPNAVLIYLVLRYSSERLIKPNRAFIVVCLLRGMTTGPYRIMQADFKSLGLFIGLSILHGCLNLAGKATEKKREKAWSWFVQTLRNTFRCSNLTLQPYKVLIIRKLQAGIDIQDMLLEYTTIILSQAYVALYFYSNFEIALWVAVKEPLIRIFIGLSIDVAFNCLSIFVATHYNNVPIRHVWNKHWKRHIAATSIILMVMVCYFTQVLLPIYQISMDGHAKEYHISNCTAPFSYSN